MAVYVLGFSLNIDLLTDACASYIRRLDGSHVTGTSKSGLVMFVGSLAERHHTAINHTDWFL